MFSLGRRRRDLAVVGDEDPHAKTNREVMMRAPDLRLGRPPRWNETVDGVCWLPRFAAKARAYRAGTLGMYLYGQSPIDDAFLRRARLDYASFADIACAAPDNSAILAEIERRTPGAAVALHRWSERLRTRSQWFMLLLDIDDGYAQLPFAGIMRRIANAAAVPIVLAARRLRRSAH